MIEIPPVVLNKAAAHGADVWVGALPELVASLCKDWEITVGRPYPDGTEAYVVEATLIDGTEAVLKLVVPCGGDAARHEITVLRLAGGRGCARLLRADETRGALLLERLGRPLFELGFPIERRLEILCSTASRVWRSAPGSGLPTGADKGRWLTDFVTATWSKLDRGVQGVVPAGSTVSWRGWVE